MSNRCKKCNVKIKKGETYCEKCQHQMRKNAPIEFMMAMMRGDILTANRIKAENPGLEVSSMVMSDSNRGTYRVCPHCGHKNKGEFLFFKEYACSKCGHKI